MDIKNISGAFQVPLDGLKGLKQNWRTDLLSGFMVSLLALPLSLGIAKASEFPPLMGIVTAIIGGMLVSLIAGSRLTIKGPAAGLIVIVSGSVAAFGGGLIGWQMTLGAIVIAALVQVLFGVLKLGKLSDFFPLSAIHGMLAAIGLIIISKQVHFILGIDPKELKGLEPLELYARIPHSIATMDPKIAMIGLLSLLIVFGWPMIKHPVAKKIPAPLLVMGLTIPLRLIMDFNAAELSFDFVKMGNVWDSIGWNVSFNGISQPGTFIKYVAMFALVGSIESLLTVKAIDIMEPFHRKSDYNKDVMAIGVGNMAAGLIGGLPMISEVARSSANVGYGARTRWANFFHGTFLLLFVVAAVPVIELIPNAALAALLISVGFKLASPKEFHKTFKIGVEQLIIFVTTTVVTLATDLLIGVASGIAIKFLIHFYHGLSIRNIFKPHYSVENLDNENYTVAIRDAAVFSNYLGIKNSLEHLPDGKRILIDLSETSIVDHSVMENLHLFQESYERSGGKCHLMGLEKHSPLSHHPFAAHIRLHQKPQHSRHVS